MARISLLEDDVQAFVNHRLAPLYLVEGTAAQLCQALNDALAEVDERSKTLHPNRLHTLLSDDATRSVNGATFALACRAADAYCDRHPDWEARAASGAERMELRLHSHRASGLGERTARERLGLPPAVARLVGGGVRVGSMDDVLRAPSAIALTTPRTTPDWGFQDVAVERCLQALARNPMTKIGLVLPTGGGKTRTALRIALTVLARTSNPNARVYWVTHLKNLRNQAHREFQKLVNGKDVQLPTATGLPLVDRVRFVMVSELRAVLRDRSTPPALLIVDEAHHAAASSYGPIFDADIDTPALFLTATPNRTDGLPIGIDEITFTITYRELEERGVVIRPTFLELPVRDFDWDEGQVKDLADFVLDNAEEKFIKTLVLAPRIDRVEEFYRAIRQALADASSGHVLDVSDIGYVHGSGNSMGVSNEVFLEAFAAKPRSILISANLLLEGFDDPRINAVVMTYPSKSKVRLMQAVGRGVRYALGKSDAYVVQPRNDELAYYFDQRWLYQEISDFLRPGLLDRTYRDRADLALQVDELLRVHNVRERERERVRSDLMDIEPGDLCRILLHGYPYFDDPDEFDTRALWGAILETSKNSDAFRHTFNAFCDRGADLGDPSRFVTAERQSREHTETPLSDEFWRPIERALLSAYEAQRELYAPGEVVAERRRRAAHDPTSWLKYIVFAYHPTVPETLLAFVNDCYNCSRLLEMYAQEPEKYRLAIKLPLPLGGYEGWLLCADASGAFESCVNEATSHLAEVPPADQIGEIARFTATANYPPLPHPVLTRIAEVISVELQLARTLSLS